MTRAPAMVAGTGRFTTNLMREFGGDLLGKEGAEGVYAVGVPHRLASVAAGPGRDRHRAQDRGRRGAGTDAVTVEVMRQPASQPERGSATCAGWPAGPSETSAATWSAG